jgi:broad specificity phosphatase PhoE
MPYYFLRHCQSVFNATGLKVCDVELSEFGKQQASTIHGPVDVVICSPLKRARQTLELSKLVYKTVEYFDEAREIPDGNIVNHFENEPIISFSEEDIIRRINALKEKVKSYPEGTSVLVVGHHTLFYKMFGKYFRNGEMVRYNTI